MKNGDVKKILEESSDLIKKTKPLIKNAEQKQAMLDKQSKEDELERLNFERLMDEEIRSEVAKADKAADDFFSSFGRPNLV